MLTDVACRQAKPRARPYKLADEKGLYLYVTPSGYRSWRWKYRIGGKERRLVFGPYPLVSLTLARRLRDEAALVKIMGGDPAAELHKRRAALIPAPERTFEAVARKWHERRKPSWAKRHAANVLKSLEDEAFEAKSPLGLWRARFGQLDIAAITAPMVLEVLRPIEARGAVDQAHRVRQRISDVFGSAIAAGLADSDPAAAVKKALQAVVKRNHPAFRRIEDARHLLSVTEAEPAHPSTKLASRMLALTAARSEPMRYMAPDELEELDGDEPIWRIPPTKMKLALRHKQDEAFEFIVPLSRQAVDVVKAALQLSAGGPFVFPSQRHAHRPMSENAISSMYRRFAQFAGRHVPHGWRATFSTIMNERAVAMDRPEDRAIIDLMLAHKPEGVEAVYNRAAYMPRRRQLAQAWADMLIEGLAPALSLLEGPRK